MFREFSISLAVAAMLSAPISAMAQDHQNHTMDKAEKTHDHANMDHDHAAMGHDMDAMSVPSNDEVKAAIAAGGTPVVVEVLGVVCDFCAVAMNKTFGKRDEVAASYVDLNEKTLTIVLKPGAEMDDALVKKLVKKSGYKTASITRGQ